MQGEGRAWCDATVESEEEKRKNGEITKVIDSIEGGLLKDDR
jgi:hypothetical protein